MSAIVLTPNETGANSLSDINTNFASVDTQLALKAPLASPAFTGTPSLPTGTFGVTQTLGDNSTKVATTAFVLANPAAQSVTDKSGSRALSTNYQNTTGKVMTVVVTSGTSNTGPSTLTAYVGASNPATALFTEVSSNPGATGIGIFVTIIVPNNYYYRVDPTSRTDGTVHAWWELA
jgi:hypothetical protein